MSCGKLVAGEESFSSLSLQSSNDLREGADNTLKGTQPDRWSLERGFGGSGRCYLVQQSGIHRRRPNQ